MSEPLTDFLLARIAEDEAIARAASHQKVAGPFHGNWGADSALLRANGALERADRIHIARHDPARVLAECAAKRVAVNWYLNDDNVVMAATVEALAAVYSDHPDFQDEWRQ